MASGGADPPKGDEFTPRTAPSSKKLSDVLKSLKPGIPKPEFFSTPAGARAFPSPGLYSSIPKPMFLSAPPPLFPGKQGDDFELWVKRFEAWAKLHAPSNAEKVLYFPTMLGDAAFSVFSSLSEREQNDFEAIKSKFLAAYSSKAMIDAFRAELQARTRKDGENLVVYAAELRRLVKRAFPKYNEEAREDVVLNKFLDGTGEIGKKVRRRDPKNVEEAIEKASRLEVQYELEKKTVKVSQVETSESEARFLQMAEQMEELKVQIAQLSAANTRTGRGRGFACYNCGMSGHFARDCGKQKVGRGAGIRRPGSSGYRGRGRGFPRGRGGASAATQDFQ
ncbi:MAG: zinc finger CCHC domain-containing protein [Candidatus Thiodiazotropha sp.]